jgi:hypothetical protein
LTKVEARSEPKMEYVGQLYNPCDLPEALFMEFTLPMQDKTQALFKVVLSLWELREA